MDSEDKKTMDTTTDALQEMQEANRIIEDFPLRKYAIYIIIFLIETALCFWLALKF